MRWCNLCILPNSRVVEALHRQREAAEQAAARQQRAALEVQQQRRRAHHAALRKRIDESRTRLAAQEVSVASCACYQYRCLARLQLHDPLGVLL